MGRVNFDKCMYSSCYFCEYLSMIVGFLDVPGSVAFISCGTRLLAMDPQPMLFVGKKSGILNLES